MTSGMISSGSVVPKTVSSADSAVLEHVLGGDDVL
jgi:hypothetical protein